MLVSEVMLQQTQASRVEPAFVAFLGRFPDVSALARASRADAVRAWSGLGYNRRAVALQEAARAIVREHAGRVPRDPAALRSLPGVGSYTAGAVASIAFGAVVAALDTNARRIVARVAFGGEPDETTPRTLADEAQAWVDPGAPGDWNQALMDLGREICRPAPRCEVCPLAQWCRFLGAGRTGRPSGRRQPAFEGSRRQARGRIVALLREGPVRLVDLPDRAGLDQALAREALDALAREGLVRITGRRAMLAEDPPFPRIPGPAS